MRREAFSKETSERAHDVQPGAACFGPLHPRSGGLDLTRLSNALCLDTSHLPPHASPRSAPPLLSIDDPPEPWRVALARALPGMPFHVWPEGRSGPGALRAGVEAARGDVEDPARTQGDLVARSRCGPLASGSAASPQCADRAHGGRGLCRPDVGVRAVRGAAFPPPHGRVPRAAGACAVAAAGGGAGCPTQRRCDGCGGAGWRLHPQARAPGLSNPRLESHAQDRLPASKASAARRASRPLWPAPRSWSISCR